MPVASQASVSLQGGEVNKRLGRPIAFWAPFIADRLSFTGTTARRRPPKNFAACVEAANCNIRGLSRLEAVLKRGSLENLSIKGLRIC